MDKLEDLVLGTKRVVDESAPIPDRVLGGGFDSSELVIAFSGAVGVDLHFVEEITEQYLRKFGYHVNNIRITRDVLTKVSDEAREDFGNDYERISKMMDLGNAARSSSQNNGILALGAASAINDLRDKDEPLLPKQAHLIHSLKHPAEVHALREIYPRGFYLIGVHSAPERRVKFLENRGMVKSQALELMERDKDEALKHGQQIVNTFHLSDFFLRWADNTDQISNSIFRFLDIIFGHPFHTPAFSEYSMFLAFSASLRSGDLSRQVGAVIARDGEVLGTGANECPSPDGGLYWPTYSETEKRMVDVEKGRDYTRGKDSNKAAQLELEEDILKKCKEKGFEGESIENIRQALKASKIRDLTEYGRVVHAEMEALLSCGRKGINTRGATLYCTTFPCHNCAKHIVAAGIDRVVFVEPYLKSKAIDSHSDSIEISYPEEVPLVSGKKVKFEPFVGVGPRRFFDLFSMNNSIGSPLVRKRSSTGKTSIWDQGSASIRVKMLPRSYLDLEREAADVFRSRRF